MKFFESIQKIPGSSAHEKQKWIATEIKAQIAAGASLEEISKSDRFPQALSPLIKVETAKILIRSGQKINGHYEAIAEGLLSECNEIVSRALQANEFFDGSNGMITNVKYFSEILFPRVSFITRCKMIKKLAKGLKKTKKSLIAEQFFDSILSVYGLGHAIHLLIACSESFIKKSIIEHRIKLSSHMVEAFLRKKEFPLVAWYLKLSDPKLKDPLNRSSHHIPLYEYIGPLTLLIKANLTVFVEIYELHGENAPVLHLSKKQSRRFMREAREHYLEKPKIFLKLLTLKNHDESDLEVMFPKLLPDKFEDFNVNTMLAYLVTYPKKKKALLLLSSFEKKYGKSLLDDEKMITQEVMKILPEEERIKQTRILLEKLKNKEEAERVWRRYLPTGEVLPKLREQLGKSADMYSRIDLIAEMLSCCEVNEDHKALLEVFNYVKERHRNEQSYFQHQFIRNVKTTFEDLLQLNPAHWDVLCELIERMWIKIEVSDFRSLSLEFLEVAFQFKMKHGLKTEKILEWMFYLASHGSYWTRWNLFAENLEYERLCLVTFLQLAENQVRENHKDWKEIRVGTVTNLIESIYTFNGKSKEFPEKSVQPLDPENYHWLFDELENVVKENADNGRINHHSSLLKKILSKWKPDLYKRLWPKEDVDLLNDIQTTRFLKKNSQSVLANWEKHFEVCEKNYSSPGVHRFLRSLRWYNQIPGKFIDHCIQQIEEKKQGQPLVLLALLVDMETYVEFIEPLLPNKKKIEINGQDAKEKFSLIHHIPAGMKLTNSPVPLELIERLCEGDYLSSALATLTSSCMRTSVTKSVPFAKHLANQRVSVAKHGVRLLSLLASIGELCEFLRNNWKEQEHHSVRQIVLNDAKALFSKAPNEVTWSLMKMLISTISVKEEPLLTAWPFGVNAVPDKYVTEYLKSVLEMIDRLEATDQTSLTKSFATSFLNSIDAAVLNILPEDFLIELFKRYLFDETFNQNYANRAEAARELLLLYLQITDEQKLLKRLDVFSGIFIETVKNGWDKPDLQAPTFHPVNSAVRAVITKIAYAKMKPECKELVIKRVCETFQSVLTHEHDPKSFLLLIYANEWVKAKTAKEFGQQFSKKLVELFKLYTPCFSYYIADTFKDFLIKADFGDRKSEEILREVTETMAEIDSMETAYTTVQILVLLNKQNDLENYGPMLEKLREAKYPAVRGLVNLFRK